MASDHHISITRLNLGSWVFTVLGLFLSVSLPVIVRIRQYIDLYQWESMICVSHNSQLIKVDMGYSILFLFLSQTGTYSVS